VRLSRIYVSNLHPGHIRRETFDASIAQVRFNLGERSAQPVRAMRVQATRKLDGNLARFNPPRMESYPRHLQRGSLGNNGTN